MTSKGDGTGRKVIEYLKQAYTNGREFPNARAIYEEIVPRFELKACKIKLDQIAAWDRQARYEIAHPSGGEVAVTLPVPRHRQLRSPNAPPRVRASAMRDRLEEHLTRTQHLRLVAESYAGQVDALPEEIKVAERLRIMEMIAGETKVRS